jgi:hypothetical protein
LLWYGGTAAVTYTVLLLIGGMLDNVLKPLLLGRGVDAPMPVILLGALGGLASKGILGMFVGATLLALGYQIFMWWVANNPDIPAAARIENDAGVTRAMPINRLGTGAIALARHLCCSPPAVRWGPTERPGLPGWPAGAAAPSTPWRPKRALRSVCERSSGGAISTIPCSTH